MKTLTIALATAKEAIRQPTFLVLIFLSTLLLLVTLVLPYFTFGEDIKMYKDTGIVTIIFAGLLLSLLTASSSVAEEIDGKTAITMLSKPVTRRQFILGKFFGILMSVALLFAILGTMFAIGVSYKVIYDAREMSTQLEGTNIQLNQVRQVLPGLVLGFFEVTVLTAISIAISTRLPMLVNMVVMITLFFLGHLTPILVDASVQSQANELVRFMARFFQWILPSLEFFNAGPSIATGVLIPWTGYVLPALGYCVLYSGAALLFAFLLFENRDLA